MGSHAGTIVTFWFMASLLAFISCFGVGTTLNMLLRRWWLSTVLYLLFTIYLVIAAATRMGVGEWVLFAVGLAAAVTSSVVVRMLKKSGYALFS